MQSTLISAKVMNQEELDESPWSDIINMAYQAEYIIDLLLVSTSRDLGLISSLSKIIEELKNIRVDVQGLSHKSLPAEEVVVMSRLQVHGTTTEVGDNGAIVGLQEEARIIIEYLLKGECKLDVIWNGWSWEDNSSLDAVQYFFSEGSLWHSGMVHSFSKLSN